MKIIFNNGNEMIPVELKIACDKLAQVLRDKEKEQQLELLTSKGWEHPGWKKLAKKGA